MGSGTRHGPEQSVPHPGPGEPVPPGPDKAALGGGLSPSVVPVPRARRVLAVAARWAPTTPRARSSWRSGRRMPGSASMRSASAARILLGPEGSGPAPRARRVVTEIIVGARNVTQATNDAAGPVPSRAPGGGACGMIGRCRTGEHSSPVRRPIPGPCGLHSRPLYRGGFQPGRPVVPTGTRRWKSPRPRESGRSVTSSTCCPNWGRFQKLALVRGVCSAAGFRSVRARLLRAVLFLLALRVHRRCGLPAGVLPLPAPGPLTGLRQGGLQVAQLLSGEFQGFHVRTRLPQRP